MPIPSREQCLRLLEKYGTPLHIVEHSLAVERVAVFLAKKMRLAGKKVDEALVSRAALLHDIDKTRTVEEGFRHLHGKISREILEREGLPEIGVVAEKHQALEKKPFGSLEEKIVFYADKRVNHDKVVSLDERFDYLLSRYGTTKEKAGKISACREKIRTLEKEIFSTIRISPELGGLK